MKKKIKILRITTSPEALSVLLRDQLKFMNNFFEVVGISSPGKKLKNVNLNEKIRVIPLKMERQISILKDIRSLILMIKIIKKENPTIVHSHTPKAGFISMLASKICNVPHRLHTVAGLPLMVKKGIHKKILLWAEWLTYRCATKVYPNSNGLKKYILKHIKIDKKKIKVIWKGSSNGININYFKVSKYLINLANNFKKKKNIQNKFIFIFVGRIVKDKGIEELIEAFVSLNKKIANIRLIVVGEEEKKLDPISNKVKYLLKKNKNIIKINYQTDIRKYLCASDCLVLPSYREGFPNVVLQASSMKLPSIVSNINGCNEIVKQNVNGLLVNAKNTSELYNAMKKMVLNKKFYDNLKKSTRKRVMKNFNQEFFFKKVLQNYRKVLLN